MSFDAIFCVCNDPWDEAYGGQSRFAQQMLQIFGERLSVAGVTNEKLPLRKWINRSFEGKQIKFFNMGQIPKKGLKKPIIPLRLLVYNNAIKSMAALNSNSVKNLFLEAPETLFAAAKYNWDSVCYRFAGVNNPVSNSRYKWARIFGNFFERKLFNSLKKINVDTILASADYQSIESMFLRSKGALEKRKIFHFPTRVDTNTFYPLSKKEVRKKLKIESNKVIIVSCGRLSWVKGWNLILESMSFFEKIIENFQIIFVGDGEDRYKLEQKAKKLNIDRKILITGFIPNCKVNNYLNAADLCVVGSYKEGWSLAMLEMLACGKTIISTDVSGANDMILSGHNGFIVKERNPKSFADAVIKGLNLKNPKEVSLEIVEKYSKITIANDLGKLWKPLSQKNQR